MNQYDVISYKNISDVKCIVNAKIREGYIPIGGLTFANGYYSQAIFNSKL